MSTLTGVLLQRVIDRLDALSEQCQLMEDRIMTQAETDQQHADRDAQSLQDSNQRILIEIAALKALHPNVDFTALDAAVTGVAGDVPAPVVPVTPPVTPAV